MGQLDDLVSLLLEVIVDVMDNSSYKLAAVGYCSGYYEAWSASGRASGKKYKAQIVILCILLAVNRFSWISWKAKSC